MAFELIDGDSVQEPQCTWSVCSLCSACSLCILFVLNRIEPYAMKMGHASTGHVHAVPPAVDKDGGRGRLALEICPQPLRKDVLAALVPVLDLTVPVQEAASGRACMARACMRGREGGHRRARESAREREKDRENQRIRKARGRTGGGWGVGLGELRTSDRTSHCQQHRGRQRPGRRGTWPERCRSEPETPAPPWSPPVPGGAASVTRTVTVRRWGRWGWGGAVVAGAWWWLKAGKGGSPRARAL